MLNTQKLLYILPDVAYIAELLPTKKEHTFSVHSFRQVNGEFLTEDDDLIAENIEKLFSKIEPEKYHLILPDFLFTNTILEIKETQEAKVKQYIKEKLLPSLELSKDTHEIETFILTQYGDATKIQLTALEKEVVAPISQSAAAHKVEIDKISPISWTIKSVISLEPSISVIQIGSMLYVAEHYIGVDQCTMAKTDEIENVGETVKTLKGAQPSIQTIYMMTNALVEEKLKELVSNTVPIQQLATYKEEDAQMPSYVRQIVEASMKTLDISDYPVPSFDLPKGEPTKDAAMPKEKPRVLEVFEEDDKNVEEAKEALPEPMPVPALEPPTELPALETGTAELEDEKEEIDDSEEEAIEVEEAVEKVEVVEEIDAELEKSEPEQEETVLETAITSTSVSKSVNDISEMKDMSDTAPADVPPTKPPVIKNKGGNGAWLKMLLIMLSVFAVTVVVGVGIGLVVLNVTGQSGSEGASASPSPTAASPEPSPSPSPSPVAIERGELSILVVNATTKAGYAGGTRTKLEDAGYETVRAANAKGDYEPGLYVLMSEENTALVGALSEDSGLDLTYETGYDAEDPKGEYDAVVVLAE